MNAAQKPEGHWRAGWRHRLRGSITDKAIQELKEEPNAASIIYEILKDHGVDIARKIYRKVYEPFNKIDIEQKIERLFFEASFDE